MKNTDPEHAVLPLKQLTVPRRTGRSGRRLIDALARHVERTGLYPALIVRPHPRLPGRWEILDGRSRAQALRQLGRREARCEVWDVDDADADMLKVTLNRLRGRPDRRAAARIVRRLTRRLGADRAAALLGVTAGGLAQQLAAGSPAPAPARPEEVLPLRPVTFHLTNAQHARLECALESFTNPHPRGRRGRPTRPEVLMALLERRAR